MVGDDGSLISPGAFMPAAERYDLMRSIDRWAVANVFSALKARRSAGLPPLVCTINLSGQSLSDEKFLDFVVDELHRQEVPPEWICFEITETAVVANIESATYLISELRGIGCRFALDDFGNGMSSFAYLKKLPVDFLKIDGGFILNLASDSRDRSVVRAINEIGHVMGIKTVAEFVEDEQILKIVRVLGIDYAQGYGIGHPVPLDEIEPLSYNSARQIL
jgi:EAL domain-containing protein (putative c-di-GMP-specific phosphodiesterase class I)